MHTEVSAIGAELLGRDCELDRLQQRVGRRPRLRLWRRGPMAEGEEADVFHGGYMGMIVQFHSSNLKNYAARSLSRITAQLHARLTYGGLTVSFATALTRSS